MRLIMFVVLVVGLTACNPRSVSEGLLAARHLDGRTVSDKQGCVYTVTQRNDYNSADVLLRYVPELSADTCAAAEKDKDEK